MIERALKAKLLEMMSKCPIVTLTGPRQSGKSTLLKTSLPTYQYVSLRCFRTYKLMSIKRIRKECTSWQVRTTSC